MITPIQSVTEISIFNFDFFILFFIQKKTQ